MKKALVLVCCILVVAGVFAACGSQSVTVKHNVIRLHILANSDSDADQNLKLQVRDLVLKDWGSKLASLGSSKEAWAELNKLLPDIRQDIADFLKKQDADYGVKLDTGVYDFPKRDYNGVTFPEGKYQALRVSLGAAAGHNWWCVMFPPLCLVGDDGQMDMEQYKELVKEIEEQGITPETPPEAPVRSWLFDKFFGDKQWDKDFLQWAKDFWVEGDSQ